MRHDNTTVKSAVSHLLHLNNQETCKPHNMFVFLKTHKTGSSTLTTTIQRYGYIRNLTIAIPKHDSHVISSGKFKPSQVYPGKYDMLVNHVRFDKKKMQKVMKNGTKYFTIIRDPRTQIESVFGYFTLFKPLHLSPISGFENFISKPRFFLNKYRHFRMRNYLKNPNLFDLGFAPKKMEKQDLVDAAVKKISKELDLVLIYEYYNESLLLLRKLLCFSFEDILYVPKGMRSDKRRYTVSDNLRESINKWSWADAKLYEEFNKTFWRKIEEYGPTFETDLKYFESLLEEKLKNCTFTGKSTDDNRTVYLVFNDNTNDTSCELMKYSDAEMTSLIRIKQYNTTRHTESKNRLCILLLPPLLLLLLLLLCCKYAPSQKTAASQTRLIIIAHNST
ncbi:galactose-3-O-sulfotransferase 2-like [Antedon mediterranea]|uniref:galactose-3-O-sulfotransferase 2-like n=1 Tax=Antedon mediterranea TaxID=105859 RepID=UPI003AF51528